jgi:hypothetical protein
MLFGYLFNLQNVVLKIGRPNLAGRLETLGGRYRSWTPISQEHRRKERVTTLS